MACSYFEGYLANMIPYDGSSALIGLDRAIARYEGSNGVLFPEKKLFIIVPKDLYCPPDLDVFNKSKGSQLESCKSLPEVRRDVAGVKDRIYKHSVYKIKRRGQRSVFVVAECASPLHTLYKVMQKRSLYQDLVNADFVSIMEEFVDALQSILYNSQNCRDKCEIVRFDHTVENLADVLLNRIKELNPDAEI